MHILFCVEGSAPKVMVGIKKLIGEPRNYDEQLLNLYNDFSITATKKIMRTLP